MVFMIYRTNSVFISQAFQCICKIWIASQQYCSFKYPYAKMVASYLILCLGKLRLFLRLKILFCFMIGSCCFTSLKDIKEGECSNLSCQVDWSSSFFLKILFWFNLSGLFVFTILEMSRVEIMVCYVFDIVSHSVFCPEDCSHFQGR